MPNVVFLVVVKIVCECLINSEHNVLTKYSKHFTVICYTVDCFPKPSGFRSRISTTSNYNWDWYEAIPLQTMKLDCFGWISKCLNLRHLCVASVIACGVRLRWQILCFVHNLSTLELLIGAANGVGPKLCSNLDSLVSIHSHYSKNVFIILQVHGVRKVLKPLEIC